MKRLPEVLLQSLQNVKGFDEKAFKDIHAVNEQVTSIRINPEKKNNQQLLINNQSPVPWCSNGFYLPERPSFTTDPLFHAGAYYVQEASSMFLEQAVKQTVDLSQPLKILDLCAAPGGKSTLIQSLLNEKSFLVSNEVIKTRVNILTENITKWGAANVVVTNNDPKDFKRLQNYFDVIVVDAPCSGSGLFRKDPEAIEEWSEENVVLCSQRQQRILAAVISALKNNGILIYSTCSYSIQEDEDIADWLVDSCNMKNIQLQLRQEWGIIEAESPLNNAKGYRFYPDKIKGEGFFIACFKKEESVFSESSFQKTKALTSISAADKAVVNAYINTPESYFFTMLQNEVLALPLCLQNELAILQSTLYIRKAGVRLGSIIRNELIPNHELAVSTLLNKQLPIIDIDVASALQYLRRNNISLDTNFKGWVLLAFKNLVLGWVKILPGRINNYYPANWRIINK